MPDPEVIRLMRSFKRDLLRSEQNQLREMARRWLAVEQRLHGQMDALALEMAEVKRNGGHVTPEMLINQVRYRELVIQLTNELGSYTGYADVQITAQQRRLARLAVAHGTKAIQAQGVAGFNRLPVEAVEYMVGQSGDGSPLRRLLVDTWGAAATGMTQELVNGVALGYNPRKVARMMAQGATASLDRMMTIARTEQLRVYRVANLESYRASGVVDGYVRLAAHDSRVCAACLLAEGTRYDLDVMMPTHPNCRCTLVPIVAGVPAPQWTQGEEWLMEQSPETQRDILGKGRYYAWQNGDFDLRDLVTVVPNAVWGDSLQTTPLKVLTNV